MFRTIAIAVAALALGFAGSADAKSCRDAAGKFTACPAAAAKAGPCKDAKGRFAKCDASASAAAAKKSGDTASPASPLTPHMNSSATAAMAAKPSPMATPSAMASSTASKPKNCKKGKPCGNSCISVKDVCHK